MGSPLALPRDAPLRPAAEVMAPARAGAVVANALAFSRSAMREIVRGRWRIEKLRFDLDAEGRGEILYRLTDGKWTFHFFLVSLKLDEAQKMDRNWAQSWDAMGVLCQGEWTPEREAILREEVPKQRAGHADYDTLVYARGNRSGRLFDHVVESLAAGHQPDLALIAGVGYILRTTAFIANGQLGTRAHAALGPDHPFRRPYHLQMCSAFVLREYVYDLVDHMARSRSPLAVRLDPAFRRYLGLGNAAATGLVAFVVNHPHLIHRWTLAHERALACARSRPFRPGEAPVTLFRRLLDRAIGYFRESAHGRGDRFDTAARVAADLARLHTRVAGPVAEEGEHGVSWQALVAWAARETIPEAREVLDSLLLETHPDLVESAREAFEADERFETCPEMPVAALREQVQSQYGWALAPQFAQAGERYFWFRAAPAPRDVRRGIRGLVPELESENGMDTARQVRQLVDRLRSFDEGATTAEFLCAHPGLRHVVARVQSLAGCDYAELRANWLAPDFSPFEPVRFVLAFFGMEKFEAVPPKQVRGAFMQGAPIAEDVAAGRDGAWPFPLIPEAGSADVALAALPVPGLGAVRPLPSPAPRTALRVAESDLARTVAAALQAGGVALGIAEETAALVTFAHACGEPVLAMLPVWCEAGLGGAGVRLVRPGREDGCARVDAGGAAAFVAAPTALDLGCALARAGAGGTSSVLVDNCAPVAILGRLALRCAERGLLGVVLWRAASGGLRFAAAGPGAAGPWYASADLWPRRESVLRELGVPAARADEVLAHLRGVEGSFGLACAQPGYDGPIAGLAEQCAAAGGFAWDGREWATRRGTWLSEGLVVPAPVLEALSRAAARGYVPASELARLRPGEDVDPLKVF